MSKIKMTMNFRRNRAEIFLGDAIDFYRKWPSPTVIVSDGPYGLNSYPGDAPTPEFLEQAYTPHVAAWSERALPSTTLWFWNSELGWANTHALLQSYGWEYRSCHIWNKGIGHIAGNCNSKTMRKFPVTTEVCVQYVKQVTFRVNGQTLSMKEWLRHEWQRSGLPLYKTNEACGVKNAATRKYFTQCHLWYFPPSEAFDAFVRYANKHGMPSGRPYFSIDGLRPLSGEEWMNMRAKFKFKNGITNVWQEPAVRGSERLKRNYKCLHMNQKPLKILEMCIEATSDLGDVVWEPFGGLCSATVAAHKLGRQAYAAEINPDYFEIATKRLNEYDIC
jgi:site-specific DNA-methyltransferase (adenine-specific)